MKNDEIEKINFSGWPIPDEYLIEIGRVSALWASLESLLIPCIGKLLGFNEINDPKAFILLAHASFPQRMDILSTMCEQLAQNFPQITKYKEIISVLRNAQKARNKFLHNGVVFNSETNALEMPVGSARGTLRVKVEKITLADIRRATMAIDEAMTDLYNLILQTENQPVWKRRVANPNSVEI
jgi:hypothetical protein